MVVLLNKANKKWGLADAVEVDGKLVRRVHQKDGTYKPEGPIVKRILMPSGEPGSTIEAIDDAEAELMLGYKGQIVDADKAAPQLSDKIKALNEEVNSLKQTIDQLKERLAVYEKPEKEADSKEDAKSSKKK